MAQNPTKIAADVLRLAGSALFDASWYAVAHAAVLTDGGDPLVHFCNSGWLNGLNPNPVFDTAYYLGANPDVRAAGVNPLVHYLEYGEAQDRRPAADFAVGWYRASYAIPAQASCLADYLARRQVAPVAPNAAFDPVWYRATYAVPEGVDARDAYLADGQAAGHDGAAEGRLIRLSGLFDAEFYQRANGVDPGTAAIPHFCDIGWHENFCPNPLFDVAWYLAANPEVAAAGINPLAHYIQYGEYEGRRPSPDFDPVAYRDSHEVPAFESSLGHRLASLVPKLAAPPVPAGGPPAPSALDEKLVADSELFDINYYLANYPDVRESGLDPAVHFMTYGWTEGRRPNPYFDSAWYIKTYLPADRRLNPLLHYIRGGEATGNRPVVYFDAAWYKTAHGLDIGERPLRHFLRNRRGQQASPTPLFDVAWYLARYGDEIGANRDPFAHYLRVGIAGDIDPGPNFDAAAYRAAKMQQDVPAALPEPGAEIIEKLRREVFNPLVHFLLNEAATDHANRLVVG